MPPTMTTHDLSATSSLSAACDNCYAEEHFLLHTVRRLGLYRRLCTSCVLKLHPLLFCPHCFLLSDTTTTNNNNNTVSVPTLTCIKCKAQTHSACVPPNVPKSPYWCPPCSNPTTFKFFDLKGKDNNGVEGVLDLRNAKALMAAATIAAGSMRKAAVVAWGEAERRVKEACVARRRAREALERVAVVEMRERMMMMMENNGGTRVGDRGGVVGNGSVVVSKERNVGVVAMDDQGSGGVELKKDGVSKEMSSGRVADEMEEWFDEENVVTRPKGKGKGSVPRETDVAVLPIDIKDKQKLNPRVVGSASSDALDLKKEGLVERGEVFGEMSISVLGKIGGAFDDENVSVHMDVDAGTKDVKVVGSGIPPIGTVVNDVCGKVGEDVDEAVAVHMDVDAVDLPSKGVDLAGDKDPESGTVEDNACGEIDDPGAKMRNSLVLDLKREDAPMDVEIPLHMLSKKQIAGSEVSASGTVDKDAGGRETSIDVQTLVAKMEKKGGMIANGSAGVEGVVSPPKVSQSAEEEQNVDAVNEITAAQLDEKEISDLKMSDGALLDEKETVEMSEEVVLDEKEISDEKMSDALPPNSKLEQHLEDNRHGEKDGLAQL